MGKAVPLIIVQKKADNLVQDHETFIKLVLIKTGSANPFVYSEHL